MVLKDDFKEDSVARVSLGPNSGQEPVRNIMSSVVTSNYAFCMNIDNKCTYMHMNTSVAFVQKISGTFKCLLAHFTLFRVRTLIHAAIH